ncbi:HEAT repeat domain-containing protein [Streptomyces sp. LP11]|uniref:HEAT repeat domain-containing protein n=1 Tax=Streptomyces pyxinicus TaxID=2970331 RepID=A0ABT2AXE5_9ACTN|nr:HEAT repeat domain-containing protein [Streptomyces sp. LP11]MCS0600925.1 HEAT repeat domain-containing protein [Streptomyces sp. LP11]
MFRGIDEVDWASLRHAHGSAEDVPGWLRGLASADTAERTTALDGIYGAVHHQGRVYDSTLACVPFLFALAAQPEVPDRGALVELLVSIGTQGADGDGRARSAVCAGAEDFVALAGDPDPGVRCAAACALVRFLAEPARVLDLLRRRLRAERDGDVLHTLTESLGLFARRHPAHADAAVDLLAELSTPPYAPGTRLAALGQLALGTPGRLPADLVPTAVRLLRERSAHRADGARHGEADTLVGRIRRLRPSDERGSRLLRTLHTALGDRVGDRIALLAGQLTSPDPVDRCNAAWMAADLFRGRRGDFTTPVRLLGAQLATEHDRLREAAVTVLAELFALAAPAADDLHTLVAARPDLWTHRWERGTALLGHPLKALARTGDARALPALTHLLAAPTVPPDLVPELAHLGRAAAPLAPELRHRLGRIPLDSPSAAGLAAPLLSAVRAVGDTDAVPEVLRLLSGAPDSLGPRDAVAGQAVRTLEALGATDRAAPSLRALLGTRHAATAAGALWSADRDAGAVLPVLLRELREGDPDNRRVAALRLGELGPVARPALPHLRRALASGPPAQRAAAACALWRVDPDPGPVLPVLRTAWVQAPRTRLPIARSLATMGPFAAPARDLPATELLSPRRHMTGGDDAIPEDEALLRACREVLAMT